MLQNFPSLTRDEFEKACKTLEQKCHDKIHGTNWQSISWDSSGELRIRQASTPSSKSEIVNSAEDERDIEIEDDDDLEGMKVTSTHGDRPVIDFSMVLSATYQVPLLYFALSSSGPIHLSDLDVVYSHVVSPGLLGALQQVGVMGGISIAVSICGSAETLADLLKNHPLTEKPMFFVHPCMTRDALSAVSDDTELDPLTYLLLWFGIVGASVGLHIPSKVIA